MLLRSERKKSASSENCSDNMDYFTSVQIVKSVAASVAFGLLYSVFLTLCSVLWQVFEVSGRSFIKAILFTGRISDLKPLFCTKGETGITKGKVSGIIFDFLKVISFGISFSFLLYIIQDGIFRLYVLAIALSVSYYSNRLLGKRLFIILTKPIFFIVSVTASAIALVLLPFKKTYAAGKGFISSIISKKMIKNSVLQRNNKNKVEKSAQ